MGLALTSSDGFGNMPSKIIATWTTAFGHLVQQIRSNFELSEHSLVTYPLTRVFSRTIWVS